MHDPAVWTSFHQNEVEAAALADTLDGIGASLFLVDSSRRVVHMNAAARMLVGVGAVFRTPAGRLVTLDARANRLLGEVLAGARHGALPGNRNGRAIPITIDEQEHWVAHVLPLSCGQRRQAGIAYDAVAAVFVRRAILDLAAPVETAATLYNLTDGELRVLFAIIGSNGIADTAEVLGLAETTVRTHLQSIFRKTGTNRQSALVKLVASLASPFAC